MKSKRIIISVLCLVMIVSFLFNMSGCALRIEAADLMDGIEANSVTEKAVDEKFVANTASLAVKLFQNSLTDKENSLISPLSIMLALAMATNGADTETKAEMEQLLGGDISITELNEYLYTYVNSLPSEDKYKLEIANSIWFRDSENLSVNQDFLQMNANYYDASAYKSSFDEQTVKDINKWVDYNTDGMIDELVDSIDSDTVMYLINALVFDAEWDVKYEKDDVYDGEFISINSDRQSVEMMRSSEFEYIATDDATGFIKSYKDNKYSFVALLPNEDVTINKYISSLTGDVLMDAINGATAETVQTVIPKFSYEYEISLNDALTNMGMPTAFDGDKADFSKMAQSSNGNIYINEVLHKTFISVEENGTKAAAITSIMMDCQSGEPGKTVVLDRPFVYAIIDNSTNLPIFIGTVMDLGN